VGKLECLSFPGWDAWINSDDHDPPHFHLEKRGEWQVKVLFMRSPPEFEFVYPRNKRGLSGKDRKLVSRAVEQHRAELFREWRDKALVRNPGEQT
jgi:hypothetical protein